ncbi:MAG: hypothetical protein V3T70_03685 [Phycisphaerae bacterium]
MTETDARVRRRPYPGAPCAPEPKRPQGVRTTLLWTAVVVIGGCGDPQAKRISELETSVEALSGQVGSQSRALLESEEQSRALRDQVQVLTRLGGPKRYGMLVKLGRIEIDQRSRGYNSDGIPGDDEVRVYVTPVDEDGDVVKADGAVYLQILDLANPPTQQLVAESRWTPETLRALWYGRFGLRHYRFVCGWRDSAPPRHAKLTVRVEFIDVLTGRRHEAQSVVDVQLPVMQQRAALNP